MANNCYEINLKKLAKFQCSYYIEIKLPSQLSGNIYEAAVADAFVFECKQTA